MVCKTKIGVVLKDIWSLICSFDSTFYKAFLTFHLVQLASTHISYQSLPPYRQAVVAYSCGVPAPFARLDAAAARRARQLLRTGEVTREAGLGCRVARRAGAA